MPKPTPKKGAGGGGGAKKRKGPTPDTPSDAGTIRRQTDPVAKLDKHTLTRTFVVSQEDANLVSAWWAQEKKAKENGGAIATRANTPSLLEKPSAPGEDKEKPLGPSFTMEVSTGKVRPVPSPLAAPPVRTIMLPICRLSCQPKPSSLIWPRKGD